MCEAIFITKSGVFVEKFDSLDKVADRAQSTKDLLYYRCFQIYGRIRAKKKKEKYDENF